MLPPKPQTQQADTVVEEPLFEEVEVIQEAEPDTDSLDKITASATTGSYYIQVGSFSKYEPNKKFLDSILSQGYKYKYHKVQQSGKMLTKVLVGPFPNESEARSALRTIRSKIEAGAFLTKI